MALTFALSMCLLVSRGAFLRKLIEIDDDSNSTNIQTVLSSYDQNTSANVFFPSDRDCDMDIQSIGESTSSDRTTSTLLAYYISHALVRIVFFSFCTY